MSLATDEEGKLLRQIILAKGGSIPIIQSYDHFIYHQFSDILKSFEVVISSRNVIVSGVNTLFREIAVFENPIFAKPTINDLKSDGTPRKLYPMEARRNGLSYMAQVYVTLTLYTDVGGRREPKAGESIDRVFIGKIPVMIGSELDRLRGLPASERIKYGESDNDPMGYFIIKGSEKVLLNIEKLRTQKILLYEDQGDYIVRYTGQSLIDTSVVQVVENKSIIEATFDRMGIKKDNKINSINIFYVFFALGLRQNTINQAIEIMYTFIVDNDKRKEAKRRKELLYYLQPTINMFLKQTTISGVPNQPNVVDVEQLFLLFSNKFKDPEIRNSEDRPTIISNIVAIHLFRNIPIIRESNETIINSVSSKIRLFSSMIVRYIDFMNGYADLDDRDSWSNKRIVDAGNHMKTAFVHFWKKMIDTVQKRVTANTLTNALQIKSAIVQTYMTEQFITAFSRGTWIGNRGKTETVIVDTLKRDNKLSAHAHLRRTVAPTNRRAKIRAKRMVHASGWGMICPTTTPEGEACGLVKAAAITTYNSLERDMYLIKRILDGEFDSKDTPKHYLPNSTGVYINPLYLNGIHLGFCEVNKTYKYLIQLRRTQQIYFDTAIVKNKYNELWVYTTAGRICRPLLIVDLKTQMLVIDIKKLRNQPLITLLDEGALVYIDAEEQLQPTVYIAENVRNLRDKRNRLQRTQERYDEIMKDSNATPEEKRSSITALVQTKREAPYTHCEVDPTALFGIAASTIPLPEFNPAPRNTYQASMVGQALGPNNSRLELRFDTTARTIHEPGVPLFSTDAHETLGLDQYPAGKNVIMAITTYGGNNQEDAILFDKGAVDMGMFKMTIYHGYKTTISQSKGYQQKIQVPEHPDTLSDKYSKLDLVEMIGDKPNPNYGIVKIGQYVKTGDCLVSKIVIDRQDSSIKNASLYVDINKEGFIDDVFITENAESYKLIRIRIRETRNLQNGDKLASRYAQKGIIGDIIPTVDMPYIASGPMKGIVPSIIFNPHGIPSRMTMGKLIEVITNKVAAVDGERKNATAFRRFNYQHFLEELTRHGYSKTGKERMINGKTGRYMDVDIFVGPVYYQLLRHLVQDKMQARGTGTVQFLTRQPISGIRKEGGLRFGEMARDAITQYGASNILQERMVISSDAYTAIVCQGCGTFAISNINRGVFECRHCEENATFGKVVIPYAYKLMTQILAAANIKITVKTKEL